MANDGKIYITISDTRGGSGQGVSNDADTKKEKSNLLGDFAKHQFFNLIKSEATTLVNYTVGHYGNFTGDYTAQSEMQAAMNAIGFFYELGSTIAVGAKYGWVGVAIAVSTFGISKAINFGLQERSEQFEQKKTNRNIEMMRNRLGLQGLTDGSRTGGY